MSSSFKFFGSLNFIEAEEMLLNEDRLHFQGVEDFLDDPPEEERLLDEEPELSNRKKSQITSARIKIITSNWILKFWDS